MNDNVRHRSTKTIGILGGMGPAATIEYFRRLVEKTPAAFDQAHVRILIDNNPHIPDRTDAIFGTGPDPSPVLASMARGLAASGADFLTMPCNTGHVFKAAINEAVDIPFVDMIDVTVQSVSARTVGLLATTGTLRTGLYTSACAARGIQLMLPDESDQELVMDIIRRVKAGGTGASVAPFASSVVARLAERGAEAVIAGCTEISLIRGKVMPIRWIDALDCLVDAALRLALNTNHEEIA